MPTLSDPTPLSTPRPGRRVLRRLPIVAASGLLAGALALTGCSKVDPSSNSSKHSSTSAQGGSASPSASATPTDPVSTATLMAAQYDYAGAEKALTGVKSDAATTELNKIKATEATLRAFPDTQVSHLFYHSLIVDPQRAFHNPEAQGYKDYMVTMKEFAGQLQQMYAKGYVLIHPERVVAPNAQGVMTYQNVMLPPGKKPLVLSVDDVSYYEYMKGAGFATNLTIGADGHITNTYTDASGKTSQGSYDVVPVVDDFIRQHPDFSYHGDKGSIALTGYNGILGYRSSYRAYGHKPAVDAARVEAKKVADAMKAEGWNFASHSYGHISFTKSSLAMIEQDSQRWDADVRPLIGDTPELIYPFGADISGMPQYSEANAKFKFLHDTEKFTYYFPIDSSKPAWMQLTPLAWRQARINVDGISMGRALKEKTVLDNFFDTKSVYDPTRN